MSETGASSVKPYIFTFLGLMVLTVITTWVAYVDLGLLNTPIAILIALCKTFLVIAIFMHLRHSHAVNRLYCAVGFLTLILLFILSFSDYLTRRPL